MCSCSDVNFFAKFVLSCLQESRPPETTFIYRIQALKSSNFLLEVDKC